MLPQAILDRLVKDEIEDYDELKNIMLGLNNQYQKFGDIEKFLEELDLSDEEKTVTALGEMIEFAKNTAQKYGYPGISVIAELEKIKQKSGEEMKTALKELIDKLKKIKAGYGYPAKTMGETVNLFDQEIFKAGDFGFKGQYTKEDVSNIAEKWRKLKDKIKPPLKLGHFSSVESGLPSLGWVDNVRAENDALMGDFKEVPKKVADILRKKAYRRLSPELYAEPIEGENPPVLRAVALLGADIPEIKSLDDIQTLYNDEGEKRFDIIMGDRKLADNENKGGDNMAELNKKVDDLIKENTEMKVASFIEANKAKILPTYEGIIKALLTETFNEDKVIKFSEKDGKDTELKLGEAIRTLISRIPNVVEFIEKGKSGGEGEAPEDANLKKITEFAEKNNCTLAEAREKLGIDMSEDAKGKVGTEEKEE